MMFTSRYIHCLLLSAALLISLSLGRSSLGGNPTLEFKTLKTAHFNIHYHQGLEEIARQAASIFEETHENLTVLFGWEVDGPTEVVITDNTDGANGSAASSPRPLIRLYGTAPRMDVEISGLHSHTFWLKTLIVHEYTHINHIRMHSGASRAVNAVFGDVYLPNGMMPRWFVEGLAVMDETYRAGGGRIRSSTFAMAVRANALEGKMPSLGELSNDTSDFPRGHTHYIYGAMFVNYLRDRFGELKLVEICRRYGGSTIPYGINRVFEQVLGHGLEELYDDWQAQEVREARRLEAEIHQRGGPTESRALTATGELKGRPVFLGEDQILLPISDGESRTGIYTLPVGGGPRELVALASPFSTISRDNLGKIYYTRPAPHENWYRFTDLFVLDEIGERPRRITNGRRTREAAVAPSGGLIAATLNSAGTSKLVLLNPQGHVVDTLVDSPFSDQAYSPIWSPDGEKVAVVLRRSGSVDLYLVDVETKELKAVTDDSRYEAGPVFDPTGRFLLYSSDRGGVTNIYATELETGRVLKLTDVATGAIYPAVSPDGTDLAFLEYSSLGWDLKLTALDLEKAATAPEDRAPILEDEPIPPPSQIEAEPYNPLPSFLPRSWLLTTSTTADETVVGAEVTMVDAASRHGMSLRLGYRLNDKIVNTAVSYSYYGLDPSVGIGFSRRLEPRDTGYLVGGERRSWEQEVVTGSIGMNAVVPGLDRNHALSVSYTLNHARPWGDLEIEYDPSGDLPQLPTEYFRAGLKLGWSYSDTMASPHGVSTEDGRTVWANVSFYHPALGGDQTLASFRYGWVEYQEAPWLNHHVFALRINGGIHVSDPPEQASFSLGGYPEQNFMDSLWNNTYMGQASLRGYPQGSVQGDQFHSLKLEYRFPLWWPNAGYNTLPLFFRRLHCSVFTDNAVATFDELDRDDWRSSVGAELVWLFAFGYYMPITLRTGYARGLMEEGTNEVILVLGGAF